MEEYKIRKEIRNILHEIMQQLHPVYSVNGGNNTFPYNGDDGIVRLPEDINTQSEYLYNWEQKSTNNDLHDFPIEEFKKGIKVERAKNNISNILDISKKVINNLEKNPHFYSNLGV